MFGYITTLKRDLGTNCKVDQTTILYWAVTVKDDVFQIEDAFDKKILTLCRSSSLSVQVKNTNLWKGLNTAGLAFQMCLSNDLSAFSIQCL